MNSCKPLTAVVLCLAILLGSFYAPFISGNASFFIADILAGWQPHLSYIGERLARGDLPLWNPYSLNGISQVGVSAPSIFYPLYFWFGRLPFDCAFALLLLIQQMVAGVAAFLLVRSLGWTWWAAIAACLFFALSGLMFSSQMTPTLMGTIAWLVCAFWLWRAVDARTAAASFLFAALLSLGIYLCLTAGVAEIFAPGLAVLLAFTFSFDRTRRARYLLILRLVAIGAGVMLACVALIPAAEWARLSIRAVLGLPTDLIFRWSADWYDLLNLFTMQALGDLYDQDNPFCPLLHGGSTPYIASAFLGPIVLCLAIWGATDRRWKPRYALIALLAVSLLVALGCHAPGLIQIVERSNLRVFRYPIKAFAFVTVLAVILAARGVHRYVTTDDGARAATGICMSFFSSALVTALLLYAAAFNAQLGSLLHVMEPEVAGRFAFSIATSALVGLLASKLLTDRHVPKNFVCAILIAINCGMAFGNAWLFNRHTGPPAFYSSPVLVADKVRELAPKQGTLYRAAVTYTEPRLPMTLAAKGHMTQRAYEYTRQMMVPNVNIPQKIDSVLNFDVGQTAESAMIWQAAINKHARGDNSGLADACRLASAPILATDLEEVTDPQTGFLNQDLADLEPAYLNRTLFLAMFRVRDPLPRAFLARKVAWAKPHAAVVRFIAHAREAGFNPTALTVLEHLSADEQLGKIALSDAEYVACKVDFECDEPEYIRLAAQTPVANFVVLNDQYYPGWHAFMDGQPVPIYCANAMFRAVLVPPGKHSVEFAYTPESLAIGMFMQCLGWMVVALFLLLSMILARTSGTGGR